MSKSLSPYVDAEVERLTSNIVNKAVRKRILDGNYGSFLIDSDDNISYDVVKLNRVKEDITGYVDDVLTHLDEAFIEDCYFSEQLKVGKFRRIKNGILAENSISSLRGSVIFGNIGPTIPIRLFFVGQVHSDIDVQVKEYGINNAMIEIVLVLTVKEQVMMPLASKSKKIVVRELLGIDIVRGKTPDYYTGFSK